METTVLEATGLCELNVYDQSGHSRMQWDPNDPQQVAAAEARFNELRKKGNAAYAIDEKGKRGEILHKFDPKVGRIDMHGPLVGG